VLDLFWRLTVPATFYILHKISQAVTLPSKKEKERRRGNKRERKNAAGEIRERKNAAGAIRERERMPQGK
jgi:hypothetical protein